MPTATRRRQIEDAASALFRAQGYAGTSVRDIARAVDLQGASLYAHVASKEDVLWSIVDRAADQFERAAGRAVAAAVGAGCAERLRALARAHVCVVTQDPWLASVFVREWRALSGDRRAEVLERRDRYEARFRVLIAEGVTCRAFAKVDPNLASSFILTALNGIADWYRPGGRLPASTIAKRFADLAVRSITEAPS